MKKVWFVFLLVGFQATAADFSGTWSGIGAMESGLNGKVMSTEPCRSLITVTQTKTQVVFEEAEYVCKSVSGNVYRHDFNIQGTDLVNPGTGEVVGSITADRLAFNSGLALSISVDAKGESVIYTQEARFSFDGKDIYFMRLIAELVHD